MLLKLYPFISYSVYDTTISITPGSVFEVNKIVKAYKINKFRLDTALTLKFILTLSEYIGFYFLILLYQRNLI